MALGGDLGGGSYVQRMERETWPQDCALSGEHRPSAQTLEGGARSQGTTECPLQSLEHSECPGHQSPPLNRDAYATASRH